MPFSVSASSFRRGWLRASQVENAPKDSTRTPQEAAAADIKKRVQLLSVRLVPETVTLWGSQSAQRFVVLGRYSDGLERDVTALSHFAVADSGVVEIDGLSRVAARSEGVTVLKVEVEGRVAQSTVRVQDVGNERLPTFARDIEAILTRRGCNGSNCHGGVKGRGGFKLSLNGAYPREDYHWIMEGGSYQVLTDESSGPKIPRVDLKEPEKSLLVLKPTFRVPHGGGERFAVDSKDYRTLLNWIRTQAPYGEESDGEKVERVEVFPLEAVLDSSGRQQLLVTARLSNGRLQDITDEVLYVSNKPDVVKVSLEGLVEAVNPGETAVLIRAPGYNLSARFGVISQLIAHYPRVEPSNFIDEQIFSKLRKFQIVPSELSSDAEFLRRVCLDVTGTLPPPRRVREFLADRDPRKQREASGDSPAMSRVRRLLDIPLRRSLPRGASPKWRKSQVQPIVWGVVAEEHRGEQAL